ncbi:uncharacterized protein LOC132722336 isoform X2 [Ruditapes philippinarum]|uniref:uncharacterized protein LOC132722336 isoform X2 n=1 Tax=Ruditapes philippinarum TaxID=129788 RepID=UPI00295A7890|nr:uncharacterized protein LOC132722336 isoform X2 [Ruditapes philippinarum]
MSSPLADLVVKIEGMGFLLLYCFAAIIVSVSTSEYSYCSMYPEYNVLYNLTRHNNCLDVKKVFDLLQPLNDVDNKPSCRLHIVKVLADHFGPNATIPHHCRCDGGLDLVQYHTNVHDGTTDHRDACSKDHAPYRTLYNQFFGSHHHHDGQCRTHDSVWYALNRINKDGNDTDRCQKDFILHLSYSFKHHSDNCRCEDTSNLPSTRSITHSTTSLPTNHYITCQRFNSFTKLMHLVDDCMSANSVWHYLDDLQVKDPECRKIIQRYLAEQYKNSISSFQNMGICTCHERSQLVDHHIPHLKNGSLSQCSNTNGTYSSIVKEFLKQVQGHGCQNHDVLWAKLEGVQSHCNVHHHHGSCGQWTDCQQDLIIRAAVQYPTANSDSCVCVKAATPSKTTASVQTTSAPTTSVASIFTVSPRHFTCAEVLVVEYIALAQHTTHPEASPCDPINGGSDDAYVLASCNMTSPMTWRRGKSIMTDCKSNTHLIPGFTPISTFSQDNFNSIGSQSGVFLECYNSGFKMAIQKCNSYPEIIHVEGGAHFNNDPNNYYVIV